MKCATSVLIALTVLSSVSMAGPGAGRGSGRAAETEVTIRENKAVTEKTAKDTEEDKRRGIRTNQASENMAANVNQEMLVKSAANEIVDQAMKSNDGITTAKTLQETIQNPKGLTGRALEKLKSMVLGARERIRTSIKKFGRPEVQKNISAELKENNVVERDLNENCPG